MPIRVTGKKNENFLANVFELCVENNCLPIMPEAIELVDSSGPKPDPA